jgi:hypothetical protein
MSGPIGHGVDMHATAEINGITWAEQPKEFDRAELAIVDDEEIAT